MSSRALSVVLAICISLLVIAVTVRTERFVAESLLPLVGGETATLADDFRH